MRPEGRPEDLVAAWTVVAVLVIAVPLVLVWARRRRGRIALVLANLTVLVALAAAAAAGLETWLRHGYDSTTWHAANNVTQAWLERHWRVNAQGFRDAPWPAEPTPPGDRIGFIGDSFTAGYGVASTDDRFPDLVRARLRQRTGRPMDVRNLGAVGASTRRTLEQLRDLLPAWQPRRIVLQYTLNDIEYLLPPDTRDSAVVNVAEPGSLMRRSFLLDLVRTQWLLSRSGHAERYRRELDALYLDDAAWSVHERDLRTIVNACKRHGVALDVVVFPLFSDWGDDYPLDHWHDRVDDTFERLGVRVLDLRATYAGIDGSVLVVSAFDAHPNERAHALAAEAISDAFFDEAF